MIYRSQSLQDTETIAQDFIKNLEKTEQDKTQATLVTLHGDLGSGKTTFTQIVAKLFGVTETVTSPTFVIEKIYTLQKNAHGFDHLIHVDAYRLESGKEMMNLGWQEIIENPKNIIMLEWPEKIAEILPENSKKLSFTFVNETTREIEVQ